MKNISKQKIFKNRSKMYSKHGLKTVYVSKSGFVTVISNKLKKDLFDSLNNMSLFWFIL